MVVEDNNYYKIHKCQSLLWLVSRKGFRPFAGAISENKPQQIPYNLGTLQDPLQIISMDTWIGLEMATRWRIQCCVHLDS